MLSIRVADVNKIPAANDTPSFFIRYLDQLFAAS